jgi:hypothetical protein
MTDANILEVLIGQVDKDAEIDAILARTPTLIG